MTGVTSPIPSQFRNISYATEIPISNFLNDDDNHQTVDIVMVLSTIIASVGIAANFTVIVVFLNDKKLRKKIPNIFIIHQVSSVFSFIYSASLLGKVQDTEFSEFRESDRF